MNARRSALITGSTSGIGLGIAQALAQAGIDVMLNGFGDPDAIEALCRDLRARGGGDVLHHPADVTRPAEVSAMVHAAQARFGALDIVVNNAGIQHVAPVDEFPEERWSAILATNLSASFYTIRAALPAMKQHNRGRIINIASTHGVVASPFKSAYVAAKHGVIGLTKSVALELAQSAITCNAVCPGYVRTALVDGQIADQARAHGTSEEDVVRDVILAAQPSKRFVGIDEIAALVLFLCSEAAASITGASLLMDGGWTAR